MPTLRVEEVGSGYYLDFSHSLFSPVVKTRGEYQEPFQRFRRLLLNLPQKSKPLKRFQVFVHRVITGLKPRCE